MSSPKTDPKVEVDKDALMAMYKERDDLISNLESLVKGLSINRLTVLFWLFTHLLHLI